MRYKSTTVLKRRCTLFEIVVDGNKEYHYISNNDRNTFFRWSKQLRLNNPFTVKEVNKYLNAYFTTKNKHYTVIRHIQQLEEIEMLLNEFYDWVLAHPKHLAVFRKFDGVQKAHNIWWLEKKGDVCCYATDLPACQEIYWAALRNPRTTEIIDNANNKNKK
jgi:hypothetical protein